MTLRSQVITQVVTQVFRAGTEVETMEERPYWVALQVLLCLLIQLRMSRSGTTRSEQGPPTSLSNEENALQHATGTLREAFSQSGWKVTQTYQ